MLGPAPESTRTTTQVLALTPPPSTNSGGGSAPGEDPGAFLDRGTALEPFTPPARAQTPLPLQMPSRTIVPRTCLLAASPGVSSQTLWNRRRREHWRVRRRQRKHECLEAEVEAAQERFAKNPPPDMW